MSFWQNLKAILTFKPLPLSEEWLELDNDNLVYDKKSPVNLVNISFSPSKEVVRKYISAERIKKRLDEIEKCLLYFRSAEGTAAPGFGHLKDDDGTSYFELTIRVVEEGTDKKPGLFVKFSNGVNESLEYTMKFTLMPILQDFENLKHVGIELKYKLNVAHAKWKAPEHSKNLSF